MITIGAISVGSPIESACSSVQAGRAHRGPSTSFQVPDTTRRKSSSHVSMPAISSPGARRVTIPRAAGARERPPDRTGERCPACAPAGLAARSPRSRRRGSRAHARPASRGRPRGERPPELDVPHRRVGVPEREEPRPARGAEVRIVRDAGTRSAVFGVYRTVTASSSSRRTRRSPRGSPAAGTRPSRRCRAVETPADGAGRAGPSRVPRSRTRRSRPVSRSRSTYRRRARSRAAAAALRRDGSSRS